MGTDDPTPNRRRVCVVGTPDDGRIVATEPIRRGEVVLRLGGALLPEPTRHTIQVGRHRHLDPGPLGGEAGPWGAHPWRYLNHSCEPNARLAGMELVAVADIGLDEEVTFNYNTTERTLAAPFDCWCGAERCVGRVAGYAGLPAAEQERLGPWLAEHLREAPAGAADPTRP